MHHLYVHLTHACMLYYISSESTAITKMSKNQSYKQQEIRNTADQSKVAEGTYNRLSRDQAESYMIGDVTYDYADHEIRIKSSSVPDHPPSVGGVSNDEFYNAEDHTYTAVDKKNKKSQRVYEEGNLSEHVKGINSAMHT